MDEASAYGMQYLAVTDAMGYQAGADLLSPEEYAEELRKDAERYRWLRGCSSASSSHMAVSINCPKFENGRLIDTDRCLSGDELDTYLDARLSRLHNY